MTTLNTQTFAQLVGNQVTAIQGGAANLVDLAVGSILRVVVEANAAMVLWLQGLILQLLTVTRLATSSGSDVDSFIADFGMTPRIAAQSASGLVTFSRFSPTSQAVVPVGALVQTSDGSQQFLVTVNAGNSAYSATLGGYVLAAGVGSVTVPVSAVTAGIGGNALAGKIAVIAQAISFVDTVTNAAAFTNGLAAETDTAVKARFVAWIASLSKATKAAISYAIANVQSGLSVTLVENYSYAGVWQPGYFYAVIDDGTGYPTSTLLTTCASAIESVRGFTSSFGVFAPVVVTANVAATITTASGYTHSAVVAIVQTAVAAYINALTVGQTLAYTRLMQVIYDASAGVVNVSGVTVNGATVDLTTTNQQVVIAGSVIIS